MKKMVGIGVGVAALAAVGFFAFKAQSGETDILSVELEPVARHEVIQTVSATGKIQPQTQVNISADVSAKIINLPVKEGQWVEKGTLLVELDRERYEAAVESAQANLSAAQAQAALARENMNKAGKDFERIDELHGQSLESQSSRDASYAAAEVEKARYQSSLDQVEQARASLKQARDDLAKTTIFAPMSGTISRLNKESGEIALGSQFQEDVIMVLSNLEGMEALVDVDENDIVLVSVGDKAKIEVDALPNMVFEGEVTDIANSAKTQGEGTSEQKTEFEVKIAIKDAGTSLRPGMTATAEVVTDTRDSAIAVPIQSVAVRTLEQLGGDEERFSPDKDGFVQIVWRVEGGVAEAVQVESGIQSDSHIEIKSGLEEGDDVVIGNYRAISKDLEPGVRVQTGGSDEAS